MGLKVDMCAAPTGLRYEVNLAVKERKRGEGGGEETVAVRVTQESTRQVGKSAQKVAVRVF